MANTALLTTANFANPPTGASKKGTWSFWVKRTDLGDNMLYSTYENDNNRSYLKFDSDDRLNIVEIAGGQTNINIDVKRRFRDLSGWYHVVLAIDTTLATAGDRVKLYINNELITDFDANTNNMSQNHSYHGLYGGIKQMIGNYAGGASSGEGFGGIMSYVAFVDGQQLTPSTFGETDATTGEWKIKTNITPGGTGWGTNGYLILKDGNSLTDESTNSNNFSVNTGTLTKSQDCPSNVFATLNPLDKGSDVNTTINGNTGATWNGVNGHTIRSTLAVSSGKYYWELNNANNLTVGIVSTEEPIIPTSGNLFPGGSGFGTGSYSYNLADGKKGNNNTFSSYGSAITTSDILGCALDLDNGKIFWSKNGVWQGSGDPANGTNPAFSSISSDKTWSPAYGYVGTGANTLNVNYGNGYFGTTAVSSAGTNASNNGIFEYDVPAGYTALSTKGLNL